MPIEWVPRVFTEHTQQLFDKQEELHKEWEIAEAKCRDALSRHEQAWEAVKTYKASWPLPLEHYLAELRKASSAYDTAITASSEACTAWLKAMDELTEACRLEDGPEGLARERERTHDLYDRGIITKKELRKMLTNIAAFEKEHYA